MPIDLNEHLKNKRQNEAKNNNDKSSFNEPKNNNNNGNKNNKDNGGKNNFIPPDFFGNGFSKKSGFIYGIIIILALFFVAKPFMVVNSGEVGIKATAGKYDPVPLQPGIHFFIPIVQKILVVDTKVRIINFSGAENMGIRGGGGGILTNSSINILDARGLPVSIDLTVQYSLNALGAPQTIATWGTAWEQKIINPVVRDVVRSVVGQYTAEQLPTKRNEIANAIDQGIREKIDKLDNKPVALSSIQLREIGLPPKIKDQIERVQIARQEAERTKYEVERAKQEAEKRAAQAKGVAEANRIEAQGSADAITIQAKAQAKANTLISQSLTNNILKLEQIKVQGKFNEALKNNKDARIFLTPGGSTPNIWVDTKHTKQIGSK